MNLPTDLLRAFVTVAERGSITAAGALLGRSQPAVSLQIKRLEELLDVTLFQRGQRKLKLTEKGQLLFDTAEQILSLNDEVVTRLTRPSISGHVHLGLPNEFAASFLPTILRRYAQSHEGVAVQVTCDLSVNLQSRWANGEFDLVLTLADDTVQSQRGVCRWYEPVVWVGTDIASGDRDAPLPLILAPEGCVYRARILAALTAQQRPWRVAYTSPNFSGIRAGVAAGLGITAVAESTVADGLKVLGSGMRLPSLPPVEMSLLCHRESLSEAAKRLVEHITSEVRPKIEATNGPSSP